MVVLNAGLQCSTCGEARSPPDFSKHQRGKGAARRCKTCVALDARKVGRADHEDIEAHEQQPSAEVKIRTPMRPVLHEAAKEGDLVRLTSSRAEPDCDIGKRHLGLTALHLAAAYGHTEAVALLLDRGAEIHARATSLATPLHCAAENGQTQVISQLIDSGADPHACANKGDTPLHYAAFSGRLAATKLLVARGADVHARDRVRQLP